ncbi:hypothetical protein C7N83_09850 [Neisseria iguanae]|uniref:Uncharacterized protein n=1 Tax=Neisseria iguanae TaxID=90242 RepID=A0A2P7TYS1_9NEIS|nr:hypothetical protein C7N83_09850 [Neisseria iguanae]
MQMMLVKRRISGEGKLDTSGFGVIDFNNAASCGRVILPPPVSSRLENREGGSVFHQNIDIQRYQHKGLISSSDTIQTQKIWFGYCNPRRYLAGIWPDNHGSFVNRYIKIARW